jgi:hypothetical protein
MRIIYYSTLFMLFASMVGWSLQSVEGKFEMITIQTGLSRVEELRKVAIGEGHRILLAKWVKNKTSVSVSFYADANTRNQIIAKLRTEIQKCPHILTSSGTKAKPTWAIDEREETTIISLIYLEKSNPARFKSGC